MNRRDFLRSLAALPGLALLKPDNLSVETVTNEREAVSESHKVVKWNGVGDSWESSDGGETWEQTGFGYNHLAVGKDGTLYINGAFTFAGGSSVSRKAFWNGETWEEA